MRKILTTAVCAVLALGESMAIDRKNNKPAASPRFSENTNIPIGKAASVKEGQPTKQKRNVKLTMGEEYVIVRGIRPEEHFWGPYQFPRPYNLGDRLVVSVHVSDDDIS